MASNCAGIFAQEKRNERPYIALSNVYLVSNIGREKPENTLACDQSKDVGLVAEYGCIEKTAVR